MSSSKLPTSRGATEAYPSAWAEEAPGEEEDRSFLLPFGLEPSEDKARRSSVGVRRKVYIVTGSITAGMTFISLLLWLGLTISRRQPRVTPSSITCPPELERKEGDQMFFVVGDWGRGGNANQMRATRLMEQVARSCVKPEFVISTGDNFYPHGLSSAEDPLIAASFTDVYTDANLKVPWYAVLGNHDYGDTNYLLTSCPAGPLATCKSGCCVSPLWQVSNSNYSTFKDRDSRWHLKQGAHQLTLGSVQFTFVDTSPVLKRYREESWASLPAGIKSQDPNAQLQEVERLLNNSSPIKIVVGHHPVRSYGHHCRDQTDCQEISAWLQPLLQKHKVMAYLAGHEHDLQYIKKADDPVAYVVSGAGSDIRTGEEGDADGTAKVWGDQGFVSVLVRDGVVTFYFWAASSADPVLVVPVTPPS